MAKVNLFVGYASNDSHHKDRLVPFIDNYKNKGLVGNVKYQDLIHSSMDDIEAELRLSDVVILIIGEHFTQTNICENIRKKAFEIKRAKKENIAHIMVTARVYDEENVTIIPDETRPISNTEYWKSDIKAWEVTGEKLEKILLRESKPTWWEWVKDMFSKRFKYLAVLAILLAAIYLIGKAIFAYFQRADTNRKYYLETLWGDDEVKKGVMSIPLKEKPSGYAEALVDYYIKKEIDPKDWKLYSASSNLPDWKLVNFQMGNAYGESIVVLLRNKKENKTTLNIIHFNEKGEPKLDDIIGQACDECIGLEIAQAGVNLGCTKGHISDHNAVLVRKKVLTDVWWVQNDRLGPCTQRRE